MYKLLVLTTFLIFACGPSGRDGGPTGVALTTTPDGKLYMGDYSGAICEIDISGATPVVKSPVMMQNGFALSGDMVGIDTGVVFGSAYKLSDSATQNNNILVKVDV